MSNFMEHIHRDTDTLPLFDDNALLRPVGNDLTPSDNLEAREARQCDTPVSETRGHRRVSSNPGMRAGVGPS